MKILVYKWASYFEYDILNLLQENGVLFDTFSWKFTDKNNDDAFIDYFEKNIDLKQYDFVYSTNFWPLISTICQKYNTKYLSWCYDNPLNVRDIQLTLGNSVNTVFCFDRIQTLTYRDQGFSNVYHLPLGINAKRYAKITPSDPLCKKYSSEVSFVGKLYESALQDVLNISDDYAKGYIQSLIKAQQEIYGAYLIDKVISDDFLQSMNTYYATKGSSFRLGRDELIYAIACEVTRRDRLVLLSVCGNHFKTNFYSYNDSSLIQGVNKFPPVDHITEMPYIFAASKINLNPSLRAIQTGIPLRAFDIMGSGGFLLSNYQEELAELFENETDMVLYDSIEDAYAKINFYLRHEDLRASIALNGRKKALTEHNMYDKFAFMLSSL